MTISEEIKQLANGSLTRRGFAKGIGLASMGIAGATMLGGNLSKLAAQTSAASTATFSDTDILNFALNLEYLEAEFYLKSTWNTTLVGLGVISSSDTTGPTTGGKMIANFGSEPPAFAASGLRTDEVNHVKFLRSALGSAAAKKPAINLDAMGFGFNSWTEFVKLGNMLEDTGMSAYAGAADLISNKTYLEASARILATEGQHIGLLRLFAIWYNVPIPKLDSLDVPPSQSLPFLVDASTGLSIARSPQQVLNIVYAGKSGGGGFFPDGLNGNIK